ncbi:MAG TPA: thioredoxin [Verrucomicrobia bacterium]|nr:thioredoxin [Verrucomicrobiota bacterium]
MSAPRSTSSTDGGQATVPSPFLTYATTPAEFEAEVIASDLPVLVDFYADWCGPCRALAPSLANLAEEHQGRLKVVKVNVDQAGELARTHKVSSIPDLRLFIGGKEVDRMVGAPDKAGLRAFARVEPAIAEGSSKK